MKNTVESGTVKPYRVSGIIETPNGILTALDLKCKFREKVFNELESRRQQLLAEGKTQKALEIGRGQDIVKKGRYSLPGGGMEKRDFEKAGAGDLYGKRVRTKEEIEAFRQVAQNTLHREIEEELGLKAETKWTRPIMEIIGRTRSHLIYIVCVKGKIVLQEDELRGIGFLTEQSPIKLQHPFFQAHVLVTAARYLKHAEQSIRLGFMSGKLEVPRDLMDDWYENSVSGYENRAIDSRGRQRAPEYPGSGPNFRIL